MSLRQIAVDWSALKSYATERALVRKLEQVADTYPDCDDRYVIVRTPEGRWTAIVSLDRNTGGYIGRYDFLKV